MTNEELIAKAREICLQEIDWYNDQTDPTAVREFNSWTTHLAEMEEHTDIVGHSNVVFCVKCLDLENNTGQVSPCNFLVAKAKRLLGVE